MPRNSQQVRARPLEPRLVQAVAETRRELHPHLNLPGPAGHYAGNRHRGIVLEGHRVYYSDRPSGHSCSVSRTIVSGW